MTEIVLTEGDNFVSFPSASAYNFGYILTSSMIRDQVTITKYDPILGTEIPILDSDHIEEGIGYHIYITIPGSIIYDSIRDYYITFDQLKSRILKGWNLLATGNNTIILPLWCGAIEANTRLPAIILEPKKAYWINYDSCVKPVFNVGSALYIIGGIGTVLFTIYLLKEFRIIGKPIKE